MGFCKALKERQPDYSKIEVNLLIITFKKFLHFIISSNILSLKSGADLYTDFCLFVCYPPSKEIVHIQEWSFIIILVGSMSQKVKDILIIWIHSKDLTPHPNVLFIILDVHIIRIIIMPPRSISDETEWELNVKNVLITWWRNLSCHISKTWCVLPIVQRLIIANLSWSGIVLMIVRQAGKQIHMEI